jgi:hypothetical protein
VFHSAVYNHYLLGPGGTPISVDGGKTFLVKPNMKAYENYANFINESTPGAFNGIYMDVLTPRMPLWKKLAIEEQGVRLSTEFEVDRMEVATALMSSIEWRRHSRSDTGLSNTAGWTHPCLKAISLEMRRREGSVRFTDTDALKIFAKTGNSLNVAWYHDTGFPGLAMPGDVVT